MWLAAIKVEYLVAAGERGVEHKLSSTETATDEHVRPTTIPAIAVQVGDGVHVDLDTGEPQVWPASNRMQDAQRCSDQFFMLWSVWRHVQSRGSGRDSNAAALPVDMRSTLFWPVQGEDQVCQVLNATAWRQPLFKASVHLQGTAIFIHYDVAVTSIGGFASTSQPAV